jgi:hypothetical protein
VSLGFYCPAEQPGFGEEPVYLSEDGMVLQLDDCDAGVGVTVLPTASGRGR